MSLWRAARQLMRSSVHRLHVIVMTVWMLSMPGACWPLRLRVYLPSDYLSYKAERFLSRPWRDASG